MLARRAEIAGDAAEGTIITTSLDRDSGSAETKGFIAAFEARAGFKADMVAASAHTAVKVAVAALRAAGAEDRRAIRDAIAETKIEASTGSISFNGLGEVRKDVQVQVVKSGNWHHHSVISDPDLLAPPEE